MLSVLRSRVSAMYRAGSSPSLIDQQSPINTNFLSSENATDKPSYQLNTVLSANRTEFIPDIACSDKTNDLPFTISHHFHSFIKSRYHFHTDTGFFFALYYLLPSSTHGNSFLPDSADVSDRAVSGIAGDS